MLPIDPDDPTFPTAHGSYGLTKRQYLAGIAMQGLLASGDAENEHPHKVACYAVECADFLIRALNGENSEEPEEEFSVPIPGDPDYYDPNVWNGFSR